MSGDNRISMKQPPSVRHDTLESAQREAARLAKVALGDEFFVLKCVGVARKIDVEWVDAVSESEIPF